MTRVALLLTLLLCFSTGVSGQEISLPVSGGVLAGTLLDARADPDKPQVLVLFVSGSGPTDRNGNQGESGANPIGLLADSLAAWGISSFRYDKRAVGKSLFPDLREDLLLPDTFVADLLAWVAHFQQDHRWSAMLIAGHSEGALHAKMAAHLHPGVSGVIAICGAGRPIDQLIREQLRRHPPFIGQTADSLFHLLRDGIPFDAPMYLQGLFRPSVQPYMRAWMAVDPAALMATLDIPTLVIGGDKDLQVTARDAEILHAAARQGVLLMALNMNHILRAVGNDVDNFASYQQADRPLWPGLASTIASWVHHHFSD
jgi:pimeloyl-ACP methyl ester carboxylesterase